MTIRASAVIAALLSILMAALVCISLSARAVAQTTFTGMCYGNTSVWTPTCSTQALSSLGESATITFPGTVPLNGSSFSSAATLTVDIDNVSKSVALPYSTYSYSPTFNYLDQSDLNYRGPGLQVSVIGTPNDQYSYKTSAAWAVLETGGLVILYESGPISNGRWLEDGLLFQPPAQSPSLYLTAGSSNSSLTGQATNFNASLTLATTAPANSVEIPVTLPPGVTTLQQAASKLGYIGFDWVQTVTSLPDPSPFAQCANISCSASIPLSGSDAPFLDPPENGYTYCASNCAAYPFYYNLSDVMNNPNKCIMYSGATCEEKLESNGSTLNFFDSPADPCISTPGGGASLAFQSSAAAKSLCGGKVTATNSPIGFTTQLVGVLPGFTSNESGNCIELKTCVVLGTDKWTDNFDGWNEGPDAEYPGVGGIATTYSNEVSDATSGTGGVSILSVSSAVPEPPISLLIGIGTFVILAAHARRRTRSISLA